MTSIEKETVIVVTVNNTCIIIIVCLNVIVITCAARGTLIGVSVHVYCMLHVPGNVGLSACMSVKLCLWTTEMSSLNEVGKESARYTSRSIDQKF